MASQARAITLYSPNKLIDLDTTLVLHISDPEMLPIDVNLTVTDQSLLIGYYAKLMRPDSVTYYEDSAKFNYSTWSRKSEKKNDLSFFPFTISDSTYDNIGRVDYRTPSEKHDYHYYHVMGNTSNWINVKHLYHSSQVLPYDPKIDNLKFGERRGTTWSFRNIRPTPDSLDLTINTDLALFPNTDRLLGVFRRSDINSTITSQERTYIGITNARHEQEISNFTGEEVNHSWLFMGRYEPLYPGSQTFKWSKIQALRNIDPSDPLYNPDHYDTRPMAFTILPYLYEQDLGRKGGDNILFEYKRGSRDGTEPSVIGRGWNDGFIFRNYYYEYPFEVTGLEGYLPKAVNTNGFYMSYNSSDISPNGDVLYTPSEDMSFGSGVKRIESWGSGLGVPDLNTLWTWEFDGEGNEFVADMAVDSSGTVALLIAEEDTKDLVTFQERLNPGDDRKGSLKLVRIDTSGTLLTSVQIMSGVTGAHTGRKAQIEYINDTLYVLALTSDASPALAGGKRHGPAGENTITLAMYADSKVKSIVTMPESPCSWDDVTVNFQRNHTYEKYGYHAFQISEDSLFSNPITIYENTGIVPQSLQLSGQIEVPPGNYYHRVLVDGHITEKSEGMLSFGERAWVDILEDELAFCSETSGEFTIKHSGTEGIIVDGNGIQIKELGNGRYEASSDADGRYIVWVRGSKGTCQVSDSLVVEVMKSIDIMAPETASICGTELPASIFDQIDIFPKGGRFEGEGIDSEGIIDSSASGQIEVTYIYEAGTGCWDSQIITLDIQKLEKPEIDYVKDELRSSNYPDGGQSLVWQFRQSGKWETISKGSFYVPVATGRYRCVYESDTGCSSPISDELYLDSLFEDPDSHIAINEEDSPIRIDYKNGSLTIEAEKIIGAAVLYDITGKEVYQAHFASENAMIFLNLPVGTYFLTTEDQGSLMFRVGE